ncbi:ectopic P granules protein 5 homolog isoform X2 [Athalia rosae]|uniref:ectopic P granules protein 5 homolog isoform X2 n=1 Tax=Athalia rosae TaxID=37344 RepID=UPI002033CA34|nr:ectopic P granules protein 5 homolog isoform X2 [Athalia rosae]
MATMERHKSRQKRKKERNRVSNLHAIVPDAPTLEEFECLLGESPTNYPRVEGVENMESELHAAAHDTEIYERANDVPKSTDSDNEVILERRSVLSSQELPSSDTVDGLDGEPAVASAPQEEEVEEPVEKVNAPMADLQLLDVIPTAPIMDTIVHILPVESDFPSSELNENPMQSKEESKATEKETALGQQQKVKMVRNEIKPFTDAQLAALYNNKELALAETFVAEFVDTQLRGTAVRQQHRLYELLVSYLRIRNHSILNSQELNSLKANCKETQKQLWCLDKASITESGECQDGNPVSATHEYHIAHFNQQTLGALSRNLLSIRDLIHNTEALHCYEAEMLRLQIDNYIQRVCTLCKDFENLPQNAPVNLKQGPVSSRIMPQMYELRTCVGILFNFQRKVLKDARFITDTREWLSHLVAVLLRVATWQDHLFLLNHILRCPGGISSWASGFVQTPVRCNPGGHSTAALNDPHIEHIVTVIATIMLPIKERDKFLEKVQISLQDTGTTTTDTVWVMLDEEGEEDEDIINVGVNLCESDLIFILHQIPFEKLFKLILFINQEGDNYSQENNLVTEHHMLRIFAFSSILVRLLRQGLRTYDSPRYRQLAKRLSALIRDIVQYASDQWEAFDKSQIVDRSMLVRLQTEYDSFFLKASQCIFSSRRLGAWQYLAAIPYHVVSTSTLWHVFYMLHVMDTTTAIPPFSNMSESEWEAELNSSKLRKQFEEKLCEMPGDESYFLLTTFANMAMARLHDDYQFVRAATIDLFQVGFLSEKTQESCSKDARSLLSNLTSKYPSLLSDLLRKLKDNFVFIGKLSLYLFTELRIGKWVPSEDDFKILSTWLHQYPLCSTENHLARLILSHLNWGLDSKGNLCLGISIHRRVALLVVELTMKYIPDTPAQTASLLAEGVKQVSSMVRPQNNEHAFSLWSWEIVSRLRLHQLDRSDSTARYTISNPSAALAQIPDVDADSSLEILASGVREKQPIACYVAVLMTTWGHSIPLISLKGFRQLQILQCFYKYEQVLIALHHIIPFFLECPDAIMKNEKFSSLIISLIAADRTYMKMAKNLIVSDFPGPILKLFSNMIETHLENYQRYCLRSPQALVHLWLRVLALVPDWNRDQSVMYLMDMVIRAAYFHLDARAETETIFHNFYVNLACGKNSGSFGSFLSWATGSSTSPSLLGGTVQSVWLAHRVLTTEQEDRELKNDLWREVLRELAAQGKTSVDNALKKACATVKIQPFGASGLAIYRWSQQALDTPMDHPLLPLLWQNFFNLFLARVPTASSTSDKGGVGEKFFEGMINLSYFKKLKKRLHDTIEYFRVKGESDLDNGLPITDERRVFYLDAAKFYKTLSLWLEEPRLQESGLYLPALPPQYMSHKLTLLIQGDQAPWLEYIDYDSIRKCQLKAVADWQSCSLRSPENRLQKMNQILTTPLEPTDPMQRIFRRLGSYEQPVPPPPLSKNTAFLPHIPKESLHNPDGILHLLKPHLKAIQEYTQTHNLMLSEHTAIDCNFLELVPTLYRDVESRVTLHALCDPLPTGQKRSRSGTPPIVHCAGPAIIRIMVSEARVSDGVDHMISQNRAEYEQLLVRACQPPPVKVSQGCVFIDHLIMLLEHELNINRTSENSNVLNNVQETGVKLLYHLVDFYTEEAALCPPTKQLITTCVEKLGQLFISGEETQGQHLLETIMRRPELGGLLGPHFTPVAGGASTFLPMYQTVVNLATGPNADLCFVLLSKFDVGSWLNYRRPRLSERSTFIDLVSKALCNAGLNPEDDKLILHELFRNHLRLILLHEFPEHYGEILSMVLRGSESQSLSLDVWKDLLGALSGRSKSQGPIQPIKVRDEIRRYATEQRLLSRQEMHDTAVLLSKHFMKERLQYGLYGLYPKYRIYNEPLTTFLGMVGHALVVLTLHTDKGTLADQLCDQIWPVLGDMFAPWITPYWTRNLREPTAAWIQQLTDDRSVLLPWIITDGPYANRTIAMFVECIRFIIDTMPASSKILCFLWQFYVTNFAHASVKDHILNVIHGNFLSLPWERFSPGIGDIELMVKVVDQYLPDSHLFLGSVFTSINWQVWANEILAIQPLPVAARMHICLLNLLVKLSNEPNVRQNEKAVQIVVSAEKFAWHLVDAAAYDQVINWYVMSCDPRVILHLDTEQTYSIDGAINNLLKLAAAYDPNATHFHPTTLKKRQMYVRSSVKLLVNCTTRHKALLTSDPKAFTDALSKMLDDMESVIITTVSKPQQTAEAGLLVTELLHSINQNGPLVEQLRTSWASWLSNRTASSPTLMGILRVIGIAVASPSTLGELMEAALDAYFKHNDLATDEALPTWGWVLTVLQPVVPRQPPVEGALVTDGRVLALYALLLKRLPSCRNIKEEGMLLVNLIDWISAIKPTELVEEKLPLLWGKALELIYRQCQYSENTVIATRALKGLARSLLATADDVGQGWGILGAIGFRKGSQLSIGCKFLSRTLGVYCLAQLPESKSEQQLVRYTPHSPGVAPSRSSESDPLDVRPSADAIKAMQTLEALVTNKQYAELKGDIEQSIRMIRDSANSLHNAVAVTGILTAELYNRRYLHVLIE